MLFLFCVTPGVVSGRYDLGIKDVATAAGVVELTYPACSAPVYLSRQSYAAGRQVSHDRMCVIVQTSWESRPKGCNVSLGRRKQTCLDERGSAQPGSEGDLQESVFSERRVQARSSLRRSRAGLHSGRRWAGRWRAQREVRGLVDIGRGSGAQTREGVRRTRSLAVNRK